MKLSSPFLYLLPSLSTLVNAELVTVTTHVSACSSRAAQTCVPTHIADHCGFDARRDASIGFVDLADPAVRGAFYPSTSNEWLGDDMPHLGTKKSNAVVEKRWFGSSIWRDISGAVSTAADAVGTGISEDTAIKTAAGAVLKTGANAAWGAVKGVYNAVTGVANDAVAIVEHPIATVENLGSDVVSTLSDITKVVESPGESLASLGEWFETEGVEGVTESLIEGSLELLVRQATATSGTNCANDECAGTAFHKMNSFDGHASLIHGVDGNIYPLNISAFEEKLLAEGKAELAGALTQGANLFTGVNNFLFGDARGRVLHGYTDEMAKHGVSRLRFSDVNAVPKTSMLIQLVPVKHPEDGNSRMVAVDAKGNGHHLITCTYPNTLPKVYIGSDFALGPLAMGGDAVHETLHTHRPNWCATVPYTNGEEGVE